MSPLGASSLFRSKWAALALAAGICLVVVMAARGGDTVTGNRISSETEAIAPTYGEDDLKAVDESLETLQG